MTTKKVVVANYSEDVLSAIVAEYQAFIIDFPSDNAAILHTLATKYGKTVHSLRAKLASLKVYKSTKEAMNDAPATMNKATKEQIVEAISTITRLNMTGLEVAPKSVLQSMLEFIMAQEKKINDLVSDLVSE